MNHDSPCIRYDFVVYDLLSATPFLSQHSSPKLPSFSNLQKGDMIGFLYNSDVVGMRYGNL